MRLNRAIVLLGLAAACTPGDREREDAQEAALPVRTDAMVAEFLARPFTNQEGQPMRLLDLAGKAVLLTYVYTSCPIQTMCPLTTEKMVKIQAQLPEDLRDKVALVSITLDPERDPPSALKAYGEFYKADFELWHFLCAPEDALRNSTDCCAVSYSHEPNGMIGHNMNLLLISPEGAIVKEYPGIDWTPAEVIGALQEHTSPHR